MKLENAAKNEDEQYISDNHSQVLSEFERLEEEILYSSVGTTMNANDDDEVLIFEPLEETEE